MTAAVFQRVEQRVFASFHFDSDELHNSYTSALREVFLPSSGSWITRARARSCSLAVLPDGPVIFTHVVILTETAG